MHEPPGTVDHTEGDSSRWLVVPRLEVGPGHRDRRADVHRAFKEWCDENGHRPMGAGKFYDR